jgi:drug/metabolite transporter (DMT)-like permease
MRGLPPRYLVICGGLFVLYIVGLYIAVGMAETRTQVLAVGLINYLWPGLSLAFSLPLLGKRGKLGLPAGILIALAGVWLATSGTNGIRLDALFMDPSSWLPYGLALGAAVCWALYSNLSRRLAGGSEGGAVPLFLLASGFLLGVLRLVSVETSTWGLRAGLELAYVSLLPGMLAYVLWDIAVRKGEIILVASLSYLTPLLSTLISALVLRITPSPAVWLGAALVFAGAILCKFSIVEGS